MPDFTTIPGFDALQSLTLGDPQIKIAVLDGLVDLDRACFRGARISRVKPYWQESLEPVDPFYIQQQLKIDALKNRKKALKKTLKERESQAHGHQNVVPVTSPAIAATLEQISASIDPVIPSNSKPSVQSAETIAKTIFDVPLEDIDAPSLAQFRHAIPHPSAPPAPAELPAIQEESTDDATTLEALEVEIKALEETIPLSVLDRLRGTFHATAIFGAMFGQPGSPVEGIAPNCTVINIPIFEVTSSDETISPLHMAHAFNLALDLGVNIIHCAACHPTKTGFAHEMIQKAVKQCQDNNILIVAPAGNNKGEWFCVPAILPQVMGVGMMKDDGQPANYSNWGGEYQTQGILAPGENIVAAQPGTDEPTRQEGTSLAAPVVTGISALLMSVQLQRGGKPDAELVRTALLNSVIPCDPKQIPEPERCLAGKLNIPGAYQQLTGQALPKVSVSLAPAEAPIQASSFPEASSPDTSINSSAISNLVYALGTIGYDFGSESRRDTFKQGMPAVTIDGSVVPANPYDARQMVSYLEQSPTEAKALIWTLNQEQTPLYALEPKGAFDYEIYAALQLMLAGEIQDRSSEDYIERVSVCGTLANRTVELFSGQVVPVVILPNVRGMYGWQVNTLVEGAVATIRNPTSDTNVVAIRRSLRNFLQRVYYDLKNPGQLDRDRALNFAATNTFQVASTFASAVAHRMELDQIEVEKSPFCRLDSNCWDVKLRFFDPENSRRAKKIFRFTVDVKDTLPVTLGEVRSWSVANAK